MKSKSIKYFTLIVLTTAFLVIALGFITADRKADDGNAIFIKKNFCKENI